MRQGLMLAGLALLAAAQVARGDVPAPMACEAAGRAAEQAANLPTNLLLSIGLVESGREDPLSGQVTPWPWTVNTDGSAHYFDNAADAEAFVRLAEASGAADIDVGCFQISLEHHPNAFTTLGRAFSPVRNADYAAAFLTRLKARTGTWDTAIADYHSALPELGLPYQRRVLAAWHGLGDVPPGMDDIPFGMSDPVVIMQSPEARLVHVYTLDDPASAGLAPGLPRVISP